MSPTHLDSYFRSVSPWNALRPGDKNLSHLGLRIWWWFPLYANYPETSTDVGFEVGPWNELNESVAGSCHSCASLIIVMLLFRFCHIVCYFGDFHLVFVLCKTPNDTFCLNFSRNQTPTRKDTLQTLRGIALCYPSKTTVLIFYS